ncbi:hypothetical protein FHW15_001252 [Terracoccus luteus]|uniref:Uncharacterized protein n=1 Tax=Terracoccus luteus TaxID=53356 RepID=A0A839PXD9_9MICO|nr:hypothetical protein [Terracoccus luteus]MCP2171755.1 hypothetical protein [Terracoccus luteus]
MGLSSNCRGRLDTEPAEVDRRHVADAHGAG